MPLKATAKDARRYAQNAGQARPTRPRRSHRADAQRLRGVLALVRRLLVIGTPPARVVAVVDAAMEGMEKEQTNDAN